MQLINLIVGTIEELRIDTRKKSFVFLHQENRKWYSTKDNLSACAKMDLGMGSDEAWAEKGVKFEVKRMMIGIKILGGDMMMLLVLDCNF